MDVFLKEAFAIGFYSKGAYNLDAVKSLDWEEYEETIRDVKEIKRSSESTENTDG